MKARDASEVHKNIIEGYQLGEAGLLYGCSLLREGLHVSVLLSEIVSYLILGGVTLNGNNLSMNVTYYKASLDGDKQEKPSWKEASMLEKGMWIVCEIDFVIRGLRILLKRSFCFGIEKVCDAFMGAYEEMIARLKTCRHTIAAETSTKTFYIKDVRFWEVAKIPIHGVPSVKTYLLEVHTTFMGAKISLSDMAFQHQHRVTFLDGFGDDLLRF